MGIYLKTKEQEIDEMVMQIYSSHGKAVTTLTYEIFRVHLKHYDIPKIRNAFIEYAGNSSQCPRAADILKIIKEKGKIIIQHDNTERKNQIDNMPSVYDNAYTTALKTGDFLEVKRLRTVMSAEYTSRLQGRLQ